MQYRVHEVAGAVAGEGAARAIGAVGAGRETEDEDARARIAEAGHRARPVFVIDIGAAAGLADAGAIDAQAGTQLALDDRVARAVKHGVGGLQIDEGSGQVNLCGIGGAEASSALRVFVPIEYLGQQPAEATPKS
jgi:hypothetical protein